MITCFLSEGPNGEKDLKIDVEFPFYYKYIEEFFDNKEYISVEITEEGTQEIRLLLDSNNKVIEVLFRIDEFDESGIGVMYYDKENHVTKEEYIKDLDRAKLYVDRFNK